MAIASAGDAGNRHRRFPPIAAGPPERHRVGADADGRVMLHKRLRDPPETLADIGTTMSGGSDWYLSIKEGDPNSSKWKLEWFSHLKRGEWDTTLRSTLELTSTAEEFRIKESIHALEADKTVFQR